MTVGMFLLTVLLPFIVGGGGGILCTLYLIHRGAI